MPRSAPIISALTTSKSATEALMRNPARIEGSAPGQITRRTMVSNGTLKDKKPNEPNPFVVGEDTVDRFLTVLGECALATKAYVEAGQPGKEGEKK